MEFLERQNSAFNKSSEGPGRADTLVSCTLGSLPEVSASGPAALIPSTIHLETDYGEAAE